MNRLIVLAALALPLVTLGGCKTSGDNYKVYYKVLRQNQQPAEGFKVDAWVKGKSGPETKITQLTNKEGMATFDNLPAPDATHPLVTVLHYYNGKEDGAREITYPFLASDAERLKDTQYIPNNATAVPQ